MKWIRLDDRLPSYTEVVLFASKIMNGEREDYCIGHRAVKFGHECIKVLHLHENYYTMDYREIEDFTHWCVITPTNVVVEDYI